MAINLAEKYSKAVQERFYKDSLTQSCFSKDMDMEFTGVKTVRFYEVETAPLGDYTRNGANRYGTPKELEDNLQEYTMTQDKAFTYTIDKGNAKEQFNIKQAGSSLKRQMREVVTPAIDRYRFQVWAEKAGIIRGVASPTKSNIVGFVMDATEAMDNALVPTGGRTLYVTNEIYKYLKQSDEFVHSELLTNKAISRGEVGQLDGMTVKRVPASYFPANVYFMVIRKDSAVSPMKINDYKIHRDPPGISGDLVEGRILFDAFVKGTKAKGIYVAAASSAVAAAPTITLDGSGAATLASTTSGAEIFYTIDGTDPTYSTTAAKYDATQKPVVPAGGKLRCYAVKTGMFKSAVTEKDRAAS